MKLSGTLLVLPLLLGIFLQTAGQDEITIHLDIPDQVFTGDHLELGAKNRWGREIGVNNFYVTMDGKAAIPVTGEFHFSRYPDDYWEEAILKMRAGGITILATYVFWMIHEEFEGAFNWEGSNDLRRFVELCASLEMDLIVRIGPFCHGEIRNGALPDWLIAKPLVLRSNDPLYLRYVDRLYQQIGRQLEGLYFKDGGPVIGIQLENEYQHSAAPWGLTYPGQPHDWTAAERDLQVTQAGVGESGAENPYSALGTEHMKVLKELAQRAGMDVPLYTATGWGNAAIIKNQTLPVTAAYPYPTWAPAEPSELYLYTDLQRDPDYAPVSYQPLDYPCFAAELGGGIMNTYERRPMVPPNSLDPMINRFLGSGANGIGYYMYHGGSTPRGQANFFSDVAIGCPMISYDFQAPIGEYGQVRSSFHRLKLLHRFLHSFGEILAPMGVVLPENATELKPADTASVRFSVRKRGESGFLFMNNFQDHLVLPDKHDLQFNLINGSRSVKIPFEGGLSLLSGQSAILPFGIKIGELTLEYATSQMLTRLNHSGSDYYVFYTIPGMKPEFSFLKEGLLRVDSGPDVTISTSNERYLVACPPDREVELTLTTDGGTSVTILNIPMDLALRSYPIRLHAQDHLVFSTALVLQQGSRLELISSSETEMNLSFYPTVDHVLQSEMGHLTRIDAGSSLFTAFRIQVPGYGDEPRIREIQHNKFALSIPSGIPAHVNDVFLQVNYTGDTGMGFLGGELVADHFYNGSPWLIGLKRFIPDAGQEEMVLYFRPLYREAPFLSDLESAGLQFSEDKDFGFRLKEIKFLPEYKLHITFSESDGMF
jgi:hypothetical protein